MAAVTRVDYSKLLKARGIYEGGYETFSWSTTPRKDFKLPDNFFRCHPFPFKLTDRLSTLAWQTKTVRDVASDTFTFLKSKTAPDSVKVTFASKSWRSEVLLGLSRCLYCNNTTILATPILCDDDQCQKAYKENSSNIGKDPSVYKPFKDVEKAFDKRVKIFYLINFLKDNNYLPLTAAFNFSSFLEFVKINIELLEGVEMPTLENLQTLLQFLSDTALEEIGPKIDEVTPPSEDTPNGPAKLFLELEANDLLFQILGALAIYSEKK